MAQMAKTMHGPMGDGKDKGSAGSETQQAFLFARDELHCNSLAKVPWQIHPQWTTKQNVQT